MKKSYSDANVNMLKNRNFNILARFDLQHTLFMNEKAKILLVIIAKVCKIKSPVCKNQINLDINSNVDNFQGLKIMKMNILIPKSAYFNNF